MSTLRLLASLIPLVCLAAGCEPIDKDVLTDCESHDHCDAGEVCFRFKCVDPGTTAAVAYADLLPPGTSGLRAQISAEPLALADSLQQDLSLLPPVTITGSASIGPGTLRAESLPSALTPLLPGASTTDLVLVGEDGSFETALSNGIEYAAVFLPSPIAAPARLRPELQLPSFVAAAGDAPLAVAYPADADLVELRGAIIANSGSPLSVMVGLEVEASGTDPGSGATLVSTAATTTEPDGQYTVAFLPGVGSPIHVRARPGDLRPVPTVDAEVAWTAPVPPETAGLLDTLAIEVLPGSAAVAVVVRDDSGNGVNDARLRLQSEKAGIGSYVAEANTDGTGAGTVEVPWGRYRITATPPEGSVLARVSVVVCVAAQPADVPAACDDGTVDPTSLPRLPGVEPLALALPAGVKVIGSVHAVDGSPVADARVTLRALSIPQARELAGTTDARGEVEIYVDPGTAPEPITYELVVEPQQTPEQPLPTHRQLVDVEDDAIIEVEVELRNAALVYGRVLSPSGDPVADVRVGFYSADPLLGASLQSPLLLGQGQSNESGEFAVPVPEL